MHPWLVYTDTVRLPTYFTCLMIGLSLAAFVLVREARRSGLAPRVAVDAALWVVPAGLVGARAAHVLVTQPRWYLDNPAAVLSPVGGWVFYGGAAGGLLAILLYARHRAVDPWTLLDLFAVATPFGLVFGRLGCLGGGCGFGRPADWPLGIEVPWAVRYLQRGQLPDELIAVPLHPAPLYGAALGLALFLGLSWLRARQRFPGQVLLAFLGGYGVGRSVVECFRADVERGVYLGGWLSTSQIIGLTTAAAALALWRSRSRTCDPSSST